MNERLDLRLMNAATQRSLRMHPISTFASLEPRYICTDCQPKETGKNPVDILTAEEVRAVWPLNSCCRLSLKNTFRSRVRQCRNCYGGPSSVLGQFQFFYSSFSSTLCSPSQISIIFSQKFCRLFRIFHAAGRLAQEVAYVLSLVDKVTDEDTIDVKAFADRLMDSS